jgi:hypothetical protein
MKIFASKKTLAITTILMGLNGTAGLAMEAPAELTKSDLDMLLEDGVLKVVEGKEMVDSGWRPCGEEIDNILNPTRQAARAIKNKITGKKEDPLDSERVMAKMIYSDVEIAKHFPNTPKKPRCAKNKNATELAYYKYSSAAFKATKMILPAVGDVYFALYNANAKEAAPGTTGK